MLFTGTYEHAIDAKQRLAIPSDIRDQLDPDRDGRSLFAALIGTPQGPTLALYTERGFEKRAEELDRSELPTSQVLESEQLMFSLARRLEFDKQGRVRLPEHLLRMVELNREVVLIGVKDHLEIHDRRKWQDYLTDALRNQPQLLTNPRRLMKPDQASTPPEGA